MGYAETVAHGVIVSMEAFVEEGLFFNDVFWQKAWISSRHLNIIIRLLIIHQNLCGLPFEINSKES